MGFCAKAGLHNDLFLSALSANEKELVGRAFISCYRLAEWHKDGRLKGTRQQPLVASTVQTAIGNVAATFWKHLQPSPLHVEGGKAL
jgi:hypothetical protein